MLKCYGWALVRTEIYLLTCLSVLFVVHLCHAFLQSVMVVFHALCMRILGFVSTWAFISRPDLFCPEEWCVLLTVCFPFRYCIFFFFFLRRDASVLMVFFCTQGRISVRLLRAPGTKCAAEISMSIFFFVGFSTAHLEMLWSMWIAFVPLLNCTIFRSYIFFSCATSHDGVVV